MHDITFVGDGAHGFKLACVPLVLYKFIHCIRSQISFSIDPGHRSIKLAVAWCLLSRQREIIKQTKGASCIHAVGAAGGPGAGAGGRRAASV